MILYRHNSTNWVEILFFFSSRFRVTTTSRARGENDTLHNGVHTIYKYIIYIMSERVPLHALNSLTKNSPKR